MLKIVSDFSIGKYRVLKLDGEKPTKPHMKYRIDGKTYDIVPMYDAPNCVAVETDASLRGKTIEFE